MGESESRELLTQIVADYVDILIANDDEVKVFTGYDDESNALEAIAEMATIAVVNVGDRGSYISHNREVLKIDAMGDGRAVDTTGAGDLWTAGFLYGLVNGYPLHKCGMIGTACGYEVCQVVGAAIPDNGWGRIKTLLNG